MNAPTKLLPALLTGVLLLVGCGSAESGEGNEGVSLSVSGGFAGVRHGVEITSGDEVFLTGREGDRRQVGGLTPQEKTKLDALLEAVEMTALPARSIAEDARDRFAYRLRHDGHTLVTDGTKDLGSASDLIAHLESIMAARR
ncbi:hypothetical protein [Streptomyces sp. VRA16 Mangrove soil]|uniref:hypothetical protein n=1 Tax=Streptomyces sp. VRA16 Mangrove soil TaxID=2817434 RepID=UPI001A9E79A1|nr:hypothetical protein [Streptomyces sp. VRA16 Mangrove soil]MBO1330779.1 hypothetical protein [Streptomyces sp. VRA16 Mangrove soil]